MIILKKLSWDNAFSYGEHNVIEFDKSPLVQLLGKNGHGKSSIALILEEVLFNKNSKGIKKSDIINRYSSAKSYKIELTFWKDGADYVIKSVRGSTQSVSLYSNGEDISEHTATGTYKLIEEIIGFDHKTFAQIVYQSSSVSLEFLTATDTNRKKFLIDLLNLSIYSRGADIFKKLLKNQTDELETVDLKIKTVTDWINKLSKEDLTVQILQEVPENPTTELEELAAQKHTLANIVNTNKKITQNNTYKDIISNIDITPVAKPDQELKPIELESNRLLNQISNLDATIRGTGVLKDKCSACGQPIDNSHKKKIKEEAEAQRIKIIEEFNKINQTLKEVGSLYHKYDKYVKNQQEWERYHSLIDNSIGNKLLDKNTIEKKIKDLESIIATTNATIDKVQNHNIKVAAHNAKIAVLEEQLKTMREDLAKYSIIAAEVQSKVTTLQLLVKTFSTTGLVAYKIECLVKDLEDLTNEYLVDMSDGRFQISFKINSSDKLNVIITDNGRDIDILALSTGERARVNVSTLLAIRKLMQSLSNSRINLLILDETIENLDIDGKERLIELLLKEESLNTVLISHSFSHPLIEKLNIIKTNNISRIE